MDTQTNTQMNAPMGVPQGVPQTDGVQKETKLIISIIVVAIVLVAGYFLLKSNTEVKKEAGLTGKSEIIYTDLTSTLLSKIPAGFPTNIPVEESGIKESYKINYFDEGVTQYTIGFSSALNNDEIWKIYSDLFLASGFALDTEKTSEDKGVITGFRDGNKLNIAVSDYDGGYYVTINFIQRQVSMK